MDAPDASSTFWKKYVICHGDRNRAEPAKAGVPCEDPCVSLA